MQYYILMTKVGVNVKITTTELPISVIHAILLICYFIKESHDGTTSKGHWANPMESTC